MGGHRFLVELYRGDDLLTQRPVPPASLEPGLEWLQFQGVRSGVLPAFLGGRPAGAARPVWDRDDGEPYMEGFKLSMAEGLDAQVPTAFFADLAEAASAELVEQGRLEKGELFRYRLLAFPLNGEAPATDSEEIPQELDLLETPLATLIGDAERHGPKAAGELPVLMPRVVLEEALARKQEAGGVETGGILLGRFHRDSKLKDLCLEVTAQIPARHAEAEAMKLTFTPKTWTAVRNAIDLRGGDELMVGWWHSHPAREWCKECDPSRWKTCPLARSFFSGEDKKLHKMIFPRSYSVALVVGDHVREDNTWESFNALYGWDRGMVLRRGYHVKGQGHG